MTIRSKVFTLLSLSTLGVQAVTVAQVTNVLVSGGSFQGTPIVDEGGIPISGLQSTIQFGTFPDAFSSNFDLLDPRADDQRVIDAFRPTGPTGAFLFFGGYFNVALDTDLGGVLGDASFDNGAYALVSWQSESHGLQALVIDLGQSFPEQDDAGNALLAINRPIEIGDIAFGAGPTLIPADTSALPVPFQPFDQGIAILVPEPSTSLFGIVACFGLAMRRQR